MLTIRMQRKGRSGHAQFRVIVQDSRFHPSSGRVVAYVGSYDPHTKVAALNGEKISAYLTKGAQPSDRVAKLLQKEGIKLPNWFKVSAPKSGKVRNADKRRSTRPPEAKTPTPAEVKAPAEETAQAESEVSAEKSVETPIETEKPKETPPEGEIAKSASVKPVEQTETPAKKVSEEDPKA